MYIYIIKKILNRLRIKANKKLVIRRKVVLLIRFNCIRLYDIIKTALFLLFQGKITEEDEINLFNPAILDRLSITPVVGLLIRPLRSTDYDKGKFNKISSGYIFLHINTYLFKLYLNFRFFSSLISIDRCWKCYQGTILK